MAARTGLLLVGLVLLAIAAVADPPHIQGFSLAVVQLAADGEFADNFNMTSQYLLALEPDRLLFNFRKNAGLPTPGASYGGWEWSESEVRGQFIGHYMSAVAFAALHTGRTEFYDRSKLMVHELKKVQDAFGNGYLSAFPESHFDRLEALQPVWAPYYVIHKIMAGLLDQHQLAGTDEALKMAEQMASYFCGRAQRVRENNGEDYWYRCLENEFGGMNEVLYNLFAVTADDHHAECAHWFDKPVFYRPLVEGTDPLPGLHANTHLAQVQGFAARYEHLGDEEAMAAVRNFFALILQHHTFSTGGSNWYERWGNEDSLAEAINNTDASRITEESCTQYNILKLARYLFRHTGDPALADFYERAILNDVIGIQKIRDSADNPQHSHHAHRHPHPPHMAAHLGQLNADQEAHGGWRRDTLEAAPAAPGSGLARPANYQIVSWQDDPYAAAHANSVQPAGPGVYIYYLPLGVGHDKNWGTPWDTFWCCYGTAVESFSSLAGSIYFKHMPGTAPSASSSGPTAAEDLPQLFVNQMVSSSVHWRELGVEGSANGDKPQAQFVLNWRVPGWAKGDEVMLRVNGKEYLECAQGAAAAAHDALGFQPPQFGAGARFCSLGSTWSDGDVVEADMPMWVVTEDLNDSRKAMQSLKAIMMGPFVMAGVLLCGVAAGRWLAWGLTHDTRDLVADPASIEKVVSVPDTAGFVSLGVAGASNSTEPQLPAAPFPLLRHCNGSLSVGGSCGGWPGSALDATFKLVAPLAGCQDGAPAGCASPHARQLLTQPAVAFSDGGLNQEPQLVSFAAASQPCHYLTIDPSSGKLLLRQQLPAGAASQASAAAQTFLLRPQAGMEEGDHMAFTLEPLSQPGTSVRLVEHGQELGVQGAATDAAIIHLVPPAASSYPPGARLLHGRNRDYLLVPIGQIMSEHYTAYFNFIEDQDQGSVELGW
ncbi:hypothetical protein CHLNCDRAFT_56904 [Chlorella variabilis]|uniref:Non-reducing end beta-L-arabinofuranosidase-like GH127 catalytic domain-containing protein n=1 Tax=Chlorella variabilis TaxID=554065 RepID=E1Z5S7_CHLVA|nr:hypothetical protein CHLNCDRAFT_56904 [Chlorella variabilis]EFN58808.1 hypothetical protein CHLNCDRAFT_56904 [Chlorella variabilis]|eukprot:XP_005850910.1 hypothetical protein CHLNCDRAFT_56904 [Chlorella variabilis]